MISGMLFYDDTKGRELPEKVSGACRYFVKKHSKMPTVVYANPITATEGESRVWVESKTEGATGGFYVTLKQSQHVQVNSFWVGELE